jgi:hypothetical protein
MTRGFLLGKWGVLTLALADHASKYDHQLVSSPRAINHESHEEAGVV